ncbi:autotransporter domain-containing protein [Parerythrobacter lacustris]|uniref:Autotransporter domain-containing protein n=1 Tax=Parerythrobacter lacustris TaxID=2969984 RepID=A0ABT1XT13_9SPHN|nr:autotransporter domain-containing protein [Parerythrobacter lacustris]MCR2834798.1 autotransporter domain-containing protein [Parerythrobacter lacustris]
MIKRHLHLGVCTTSIALALASSPAIASESEEGAPEAIAAEAQGTFNGFRIEASREAIANARLTFDFAPVPVSHDFNGRLNPPDPELIVRTNIGVAGSVDTANTLPSVVQIFLRNNATGGVFFNCTGTMINPRTVLTAAHCLNDSSSEAYGTAETGDLSLLVATGFNTAPRLFGTINGGLTYAEGGAAQSSDVIIHPSSNLDNGGLGFPYADVAFIALDEPITDVPYMPLLLSPLDQLTHVIVTGYGTRGTGDGGGAGIDFLRRVGENMLGAVASNADFIDNVFFGFAPTADTFGIETQAMYFIDFDDPIRTPAEQAQCTFTGTNISCASLEAVKAIDWFAGDALPREAGTAPGDSGSPLIVDQLYGMPVVAGVLSGGYDFFNLNNRYGDVSFYNPLYLFHEFITENTPYKYVSARSSGRWSNPNTWTQDLDPGFFIDDGNGNLINALPTGPEEGVYGTGPKLGSILGNDITGETSDPSFLLPPEGTPDFGGNLPESSRLLGPGSNRFVPQNTDGTVGTAFANPAQYFDVLLHRPGTITVDMDVEIDKLTLDHSAANFKLPDGWEFTTIIGLEHYAGTSTIDGQFNAPLIAHFGGLIQGTGTIKSDAFFNVTGQLSPDTLAKFGTLTVDGNYIQTSGGALLINVSKVRNTFNSDRLVVTGGASLAGTLALKPTGAVRYGDNWTVLSAGSITGNFENVSLVTNSPLLYGISRVRPDNTIHVEIGARPIAPILGPTSGLTSLGDLLDRLRGNRFSAFSNLFDIVDTAGFDVFGQTLASLTPTSGFGQAATANGFSQRITGQLAQRTLTLRGANDAVAGFSAAGNAGFAQAGVLPGEAGKLGFFGSVSGSFLHMGQTDDPLNSNVLTQATLTQAGELTLGTDYAVNDRLSLGIAVSRIRSSANARLGEEGLRDESSAVAVYGAAKFGKGFVDFHAGHAEQRFGLERASTGDFVSAFDSARGVAQGSQAFAAMRVGYALEPAKGLTVGPVASVDYVRSDLGGYTEFGAGSLGLNVRDRSLTSLGAKLGGMAAVDLPVGRKGKLTAFGSVAYARELADREDVVTASFFGAPDDTFTISNRLDPEWVSVNAGAELALSDRLSASASVTSDIGRGVLSNDQANLTLNWRF